MATLVEKLLRRFASHGASLGESPQAPCPPEMIAHVDADARRRLGLPLPAGYVEFLRLCNGLAFNGLYVLAARPRSKTGLEDPSGIEGVVDDNEDYWEAHDDGRLVLAYDEAYAYAHDATNDTYLRHLRVEGTVGPTYASFGEMLGDALDSANVPVADLLPPGFTPSRPRRLEG